MRSLIFTFGRCGWGVIKHPEYPARRFGWVSVCWTKDSIIGRIIAGINLSEKIRAKLEEYERSLAESKWALEKRQALAETRQLHFPEPEDPQQVLPIGPGPALDDLAEELAAIATEEPNQ